MAPPAPTHTLLWKELFAAPDLGDGTSPTALPPMCETLSLLAHRPCRDEQPFAWIDDPFQQLLLEHASQLAVEASRLQERRRCAEGVALCAEPKEGVLSPPQSPSDAALLDHMSQLRSEEARLQERRQLADALCAEYMRQELLLSPPCSPRGAADSDCADALPRWAKDGQREAPSRKGPAATEG